MTCVILDPFDLPFGMLITHIFESHFMFLEYFALVRIKQRYNSHAFLIVGFTHFGCTRGLKTYSVNMGSSPDK